MRKALFIIAIAMFMVGCGNTNSKVASAAQENAQEEAQVSVEEANDTKAYTYQSVQIGEPKLLVSQSMVFVNSSGEELSFACYSLNEIENSKTFSYDFDKDGENEQIVISRCQNGFSITGSVGEDRNEIISFSNEEVANIHAESIQLSAHDFDGNGIWELIVSVGSDWMEIYHFIYQIHKYNEQHFTDAGNFESQQCAIVNGCHIEAPDGSQGLFDAYQYHNGKIEEDDLSNW